MLTSENAAPSSPYLRAATVRLPVWAQPIRSGTMDLVPVRVLIVDDHESFRSSARLLLEAEGYEVIGEAETGASGLDAAAELQPDVILLDVHLPDVDGFDVAARLATGPGAPRVVITSSRDASDFGPLIQRSGALGFVPKNELSGEALAALLD
jgi:DNA-binding NarL/FixJ family response regulator